MRSIILARLFKSRVSSEHLLRTSYCSTINDGERSARHAPFIDSRQLPAMIKKKIDQCPELVVLTLRRAKWVLPYWWLGCYRRLSGLLHATRPAKQSLPLRTFATYRMLIDHSWLVDQSIMIVDHSEDILCKALRFPEQVVPLAYTCIYYSSTCLQESDKLAVSCCCGCAIVYQSSHNRTWSYFHLFSGKDQVTTYSAPTVVSKRVWLAASLKQQQGRSFYAINVLKKM